jgi:hypothetical protein
VSKYEGHDRASVFLRQIGRVKLIPAGFLLHEPAYEFLVVAKNLKVGKFRVPPEQMRVSYHGRDQGVLVDFEAPWQGKDEVEDVLPGVSVSRCQALEGEIGDMLYVRIRRLGRRALQDGGG